MESNQCRKLSLLGFAHPVEGSLFQVQGATGKATLIRSRFRRKPGCGFGIIMYDMYLKIVNLIYVCIKSNVKTLEPCNIYLVGIYSVSIDAGAQVAIILLAFGPCVVIVNCWDRFCTLDRASRTNETLPDFHEWCRVTRHPRVFRRLTGCQRTPGFWGVTPTLSASVGW